jgi:CRISPR-associated protein Cmr1
MLTRAYTIRFVTPAFLGNAEQAGQWRTPPIKALLRQWWRVAYAADQRGAVDVAALRTAEGRLFGVAADGDGESRQSQVRLRLNRWDTGRLTDWRGLDGERVLHPEVKGRDGRPAPVGAQLYLGYGPLTFAQGQTALKANAAIQAGEEATLGLAYPAGAEAARLDTALALMHRYGTLGGRSRNGWGSFLLTPVDGGTPALAASLDHRLVADWQEALKLDWPYAIGRDATGPLIWQTEPLADWKLAMRRLAAIKIGLRTQKAFRLDTGKNAATPELRHWLSYPVTNHNVVSWKERDGKRDLRLPNSLRFKVRVDGDGRLRGAVFHVPCRPPAQFKPDPKAIEAVWRQVHAYLDADRQLARTAA